jgi:glucose-1-phosphate cytidylyltransferase
VGRVVKVVILCGGKGTRLREETEFMPKPLVEICGRPILWHIMKGYASFGLNEFVLCLGHKGEMIKDYFLHYDVRDSDFELDLLAGQRRHLKSANGVEDWKITFAETGEETNTGGRIKRIEPYVDGDHFMATYGDGVSNVDIGALERFFLDKKKIAVITGVHPWSKYGQFKVDENGTVIDFVEKPKLADLINGGFFVFDRRIFDYLDDDSVLEREPFERLARAGEIAMHSHEGFWHSMDTYKDFEELNGPDFAHMPWKTW